jgi:hypothetical protein
MADQDSTLTKEYLQSIFEYKDGNLYRKITTSPKAKVGKKVGFLISRKRVQTVLNKKYYLVHRLIFMMFHGYMPKLIDHINGNSLDNRIENLREATHSQNCMNRKLSKSSKSRVKNVCLNKPTNKWKAFITVNNKQIHLGYFVDIKDAEQAVIEARKKYHKEFANNG